jgi:hypothetical protein
LRRAKIAELVDFADLPIFSGAVNYSLILRLRRCKSGEQKGSFEASVVKSGFGRKADPHKSAKAVLSKAELSGVKYMEVSQEKLPVDDFWELASVEAKQLVARLRSISRDLGSLTATISKGIWTGKKEAFVLENEERQMDIESELLRPVVDGRDVDRYIFDPAGKAIIYPYRLEGDSLKVVDIQAFPEAKGYLAQYRSDLEKRRNWGETILEAGRAWYEIWNPSPALQKPKILVQDIADRSRFSFDPKGEVLAMDTCYAIVPEADIELSGWMLLGLLNSTLLEFVFRQSSPTVQGGFYRYKTQYLERVPIVYASEENQESLEAVERAAKRISDLRDRELKLSKALSPFKFLDRGVSFRKLMDVFREEVKFSEQVFDFGRIRHDIDGLRLSYEEGGKWVLEVQLKKRDPSTGWSEWIKDGYEIAREWVVGYRFQDIQPAKAIYYQKAFEVLSEFVNAGSFPGGRTRTTKKKLELTSVPAFDEDVDLEPLVELTEELRSVGTQIETLDRRIDELVFDLYGLSAEEIAVVEKG